MASACHFLAAHSSVSVPVQFAFLGWLGPCPPPLWLCGCFLLHTCCLGSACSAAAPRTHYSGCLAPLSFWAWSASATWPCTYVCGCLAPQAIGGGCLPSTTFHNRLLTIGLTVTIGCRRTPVLCPMVIKRVRTLAHALHHCPLTLV